MHIVLYPSVARHVQVKLHIQHVEQQDAALPARITNEHSNRHQADTKPTTTRTRKATTPSVCNPARHGSPATSGTASKVRKAPHTHPCSSAMRVPLQPIHRGK